MKIQTQEFVKFCHYYNNDKFCPFEELGCNFLHKVAQNCGLGKKCKIWLCPRQHLEKEMDNVIDTDEKQFKHGEEQFSVNDEHVNEKECDSFVTSTPRKENYQCQECVNQTKCTDCLVGRVIYKCFLKKFLKI